MATKAQQKTLRFPLAGVDRRTGFQAQPQFTTPAALNVYPDDTAQGRARGGARPGLSKAITTDLPGPYQLLGSLNVDRGSGSVNYRRVIFGVVAGEIYWMNQGDSTWTILAGGPYLSPTLASIEHAVREQKVYFADCANVNGTDLALDGGYEYVVTSASVGAWSLAGINASNIGQWSLEILSGTGFTVGTYAISEYAMAAYATGTIVVASGVVTKTGGTAFPAWAAAGSLTVGGNTYTVNTRDGDNQVTLDNLAINVGSTGTYSLALLSTQLLLSTDPGVAASTGGSFRLHRTPKIWDVPSGTVTTWTASTGTTPTDCKLICEYRDRLILAGEVYNPHRWYASRSGNPLDFNYGVFDATSATAYSNYLGGQIGEPITALIPHGYDCLALGAQDAIYVMRGDPANTGSHLIKVDDVVGVLSARSWCKTAADETVMLTRDGLYYMPSGCGVAPTSISREKLPEELIAIDPTDNYINLVYDPLLRCIYIWVVDDQDTPGTVSTCWLYHWEHKAFWPVTLPATMQPTAVHDFSPLATANKSSVVLGSYDGIARQFNKAAEDDDATDFASYVDILFRISANIDLKAILQRLRILAGADSGAFSWRLVTANSAEQAAALMAAGTYTYSGTVDSYAIHPRLNGHYACLRLLADGSAAQWIFEEALAQIREAGRMR